MTGSTTVDSNFLLAHKEQLDEVFQVYLDDINPFIVQFEILKNEFPIELQNEIRAMYGHLARAAIAATPEEAERNLAKIKSHTKRALLDCYKYSCIIFSDQYEEFFRDYHGVDLTYLEDGNFLRRVHQLREAATEQLKAAKCAETSNISEDTLFELYQEAYNQFADIDQILEEARKHAAVQSAWSWDSPALGWPFLLWSFEHSFIFRYQSIFKCAAGISLQRIFYSFSNR